MSHDDLIFLAEIVALQIVITELLLLACWRSFGDGGAYIWYSCAVRIFSYAPCLVGANGGHGIMPLPLASALFLRLCKGGGEIVWLYGLPEVFAGVICCLVAFVIREKMISPQ